jgi:hypothetical protein
MYYAMVSYFLGIDIGVIMTSRKDGLKKKAIHFSIPSMRSLFKTIERFLKATYKVRVILNIARRLFHVDLLVDPHVRGQIQHPSDGPPIYVRKQGLEQGRWNSFWLQGQRFHSSQFLQLERIFWQLTKCYVFQHFHLMHA